MAKHYQRIPREDFLDIAEAESEANVNPNRALNNIAREVEVSIADATD